MERETLLQLVEKAREHNRDAFEELVLGQEQSLYKTAKYYLDSDQDVADAIQEAIVKAWVNLDRLKENAYFSTWLTRILINICKNMQKREHAAEPKDMSEMEQQMPTWQHEYEETEWLQTFRMLKERDQRVLTLYYLQGYNTREISEILQITESAARSMLYQAKKHLKAIMDN